MYHSTHTNDGATANMQLIFYYSTHTDVGLRTDRCFPANAYVGGKYTVLTDLNIMTNPYIGLDQYIIMKNRITANC